MTVYWLCPLPSLKYDLKCKLRMRQSLARSKLNACRRLPTDQAGSTQAPRMDIFRSLLKQGQLYAGNHLRIYLRISCSLPDVKAVASSLSLQYHHVAMGTEVNANH